MRTTMIYARIADERLQQLVRLLPRDWCGSINGNGSTPAEPPEDASAGDGQSTRLSWPALLLLMGLRG